MSTVSGLSSAGPRGSATRSGGNSISVRAEHQGSPRRSPRSQPRLVAGRTQSHRNGVRLLGLQAVRTNAGRNPGGATEQFRGSTDRSSRSNPATARSPDHSPVSAPFAHEVIGASPGGTHHIAMCPLRIELLDPLLSGQDMEIAIDRPEGDSRHLRTNLLVDPLRRRVCARRAQDWKIRSLCLLAFVAAGFHASVSSCTALVRNEYIQTPGMSRNRYPDP